MEPVPRILFYVQHLLGVGHLRRTLAIAKACSSRGVEVHVVSGGVPLKEATNLGFDFHQLPPAHIACQDFSRLLQSDGTPIDDHWRSRRSEQLSGLVERLRPQVLVTELYPFGRRQLSFELLPLLCRAQELQARVVCSIRDVVHKRKDQRERETVDLLDKYFACVLVHGDEEFIPLQESFGLTDQIRSRVHYTGMVSTAPEVTGGQTPNGEVIVSAGGGAAGEALYRTAVRAAGLDGVRDFRWRILLGSQVDPELPGLLLEQTPENVQMEPNRLDFQQLLGNARLSISQAGYNSVVDVLASGVPALLVPFQGDGSETEQPMRGRRLEEIGRVEIIDEDKLSPEQLAQTVARLAGPEPWRLRPWVCDGARVSAELIAGWAREAR
ncbi:MAG: glycosyltransferase [Pseudomonadota bacterium]|nr:glycosyltransferase [Pseudomonadota bacterium]